MSSNDRDRHEARALLSIVRRDWAELDRLRGERPLDPGVLVDLAKAADVHPWVHATLQEAGRLGVVGEAGAARLDGMRRKCRVDNLLLLARLEEALDLLRAVGIVPVVLKGLSTIHRFGVGFDTRTVDDVDLLVHPRDVAKGLETLAAAGWHPPPPAELDHWLRSSHHAPLSSPGPVTVEFELHWNLVQQRRYALDASELLERAEPLDVGGRRVLRLEDHDAVAHLLLHHLAHYFDRRLKWALDLEHLVRVPGFSWSTVAERLRRWDAGATAGMALRHLRKLVPNLIPDDALRLMPAALWRRALTAPLLSRHPLEYFRASDRRGVRLYLGAVLFEHPLRLPSYLLFRARRDDLPEASAIAGYERTSGKEPDHTSL